MVSPSTGYSHGCALHPTASMDGKELVNSYSPTFLVGSLPQFLQKQLLSLFWQPFKADMIVSASRRGSEAQR